VACLQSQIERQLPTTKKVLLAYTVVVAAVASGSLCYWFFWEWRVLESDPSLRRAPANSRQYWVYHLHHCHFESTQQTVHHAAHLDCRPSFPRQVGCSRALVRQHLRPAMG